MRSRKFHSISKWSEIRLFGCKWILGSNFCTPKNSLFSPKKSKKEQKHVFVGMHFFFGCFSWKIAPKQKLLLTKSSKIGTFSKRKIKALSNFEPESLFKKYGTKTWHLLRVTFTKNFEVPRPLVLQIFWKVGNSQKTLNFS